MAAAAGGVLLTATIGLAVVSWSEPPPLGFTPWPAQLLGAVTLLGAPILAAVLARSPQGQAYGRWWAVVGLGFGTSLFAEAYLAFAVGTGGSSGDGFAVAGTVGDLGWVMAVTALPFLLLHFPDGAAPSGRWLVLERILGAASVAALIGVLLLPGESSVAPVERAVLTSAVPQLGLILVAGGVLFLLAGNVPALVSLVVRYRRADAGRRAQIKWVVYAATLFGLSLLLLAWWDAPGIWDTVVEAAPVVGLLTAVGVAVLRHRVVDVDLLINRSLVYGLLTLGVIGVYIGLVGFLSVLFDRRADLPVTLVATAVVTVAFQPVRERVQRWVNRLMYGDRDDPLAVVSRLAGRLEAAIPTEEVLPTVVQTTARALRFPHASIWQYRNGALHLAANYGAAPATEEVPAEPDPADSGPVAVDRLQPGSALRAALAPTGATLAYHLQHRGAAVGVLCVAPRDPGEPWKAHDLSALAALAGHVGAAVHGTTLAHELQLSLVELQSSRELLVAAQEEERRRIQRDLHDGLGPTLAAVRLHLEGCLDGGAGTPPQLRTTLERIDDLVSQAATDVRRLVQGLYPPLLAQLGLVPALRLHVEQFGEDVGIGTRFCVGAVPPVPPAAEVAVFRVAQEALTNVARHARASTVQVTLSSTDGWIRLVIRDDGIGMPTRTSRRGTGLSSMRDRAALLGGRLTVGEAKPSGTEIALDVPVEVAR